MAVPFFPMTRHIAQIRAELISAIGNVLDSGEFILGKHVENFEKEFAAYIEARFAVGVSSGSDALLISLMCAGIKSGDEVITTPYTFFATAGAVARLGAKIVFVDIEPDSYNINWKKIEERITERTKALIPVDLFGQPARMDRLCEIAERRGIPVIEDAAQAVGAKVSGRAAGSFPLLGTFSFFPSKNLGTIGDGGMVTTSDEATAEKLKLLRNHGAKPKYYHSIVGGNFRLDALHAAVLSVKMKHLEKWTEQRIAAAERYVRLFEQSGVVGSGFISLPSVQEEMLHVFNQFVIRCVKRDELQKFLTSREIGTAVYYPLPLHLQKCFEGLGYKEGDFPESEKASHETLAIPIFPEITEAEQEEVVGRIVEFFNTV